GRAFDLELSLEGASGCASARELIFCLHWLRGRGQAAQFVAPGRGDIEEMAAIARHYQCALSVTGCSADGREFLERIARATAGRLRYKLGGELASDPGHIDFIAEHLVG